MHSVFLWLCTSHLYDYNECPTFPLHVTVYVIFTSLCVTFSAAFNTPVTHKPATPIMISNTSPHSGSPVRWVNVSDLALPVGHISGWTEHMEQEYFQDSVTDIDHVTESSTASGSNATNSTVAPEGCPWSFGWCWNVPRVLLGQYIGGSVAISIGYPICNVMTYTLFSKVLGPQPQVSNSTHTELQLSSSVCDLLFLFLAMFFRVVLSFCLLLHVSVPFWYLSDCLSFLYS